MPAADQDADADASASPFIKHSVAVEPHVYERDDHFCRFQPRIHRDSHLADAGSWQCQIDFLGSSAAARADSVRNQGHKSYAVGCINPVAGNFAALCACEAVPDRLALTTYMIEYAYIHDDVIEYAENKNEAKLWEANHELIEGLSLSEDVGAGTKDHVRRRQLQAKMAVEMMDVDKVQGKECLRLWKEMSDVFVQIRDLNFTTVDEYLVFRAIDAGCPWTMSLLCFSMDLHRTKEEVAATAEMTDMAYGAWVLVNDYFSWEKEWKNYTANGSVGLIVSAVWFFMKWHSVDAEESKRMIRKEIMAREEKYEKMRDEFLARGNHSRKTLEWINLLDNVTAGNFVWSMTTARYHTDVEDSYPGLRKAHLEKGTSDKVDSLSIPISANAAGEEARHDSRVGTPTKSRAHDPQTCDTQDQAINDGSNLAASQESSESCLADFEATVLEPYQYIASMPSKGVRNSVIDGLEAWYRVPEKSLATIREIVTLLHSSSLMIDDIEDNSLLRRGMPAAHTLFGVAQTINAANLLMFKALKLTTSLSPAAVKIFTDCLIDEHVGQGMDLHWKFQTKIPSEEEYFTMVDGKTGGLFRLVAGLMRSEATINKDLDISPVMKLFGRFFQARDDYQNLVSSEASLPAATSILPLSYTHQKGFAEDIGEGKISLPLIHALRQDGPRRGRLLSILQQRKSDMGLSAEIRKLALDDIKAAGGVEYTRQVVKELQRAVGTSLSLYEAEVGTKNFILRLVQKKLELD